MFFGMGVENPQLLIQILPQNDHIRCQMTIQVINIIPTCLSNFLSLNDKLL